MPMEYPTINELPDLLNAESWHWEKVEFGWSYDFWVGTDSEGNEWIVKMKGSFYSYREHAFARLAQALDVSCQASSYLILPDNCPPLLANRDAEKGQLAIWLYPKHGAEDCNDTCPVNRLYEKLRDPAIDSTEALSESTIRNAIDWARVNMLAYICGANEGGEERLITPDHQLFMIDNEQMFSTSPGNLMECHFVTLRNGSVSETGMRIAIDLCEKFTILTDSEINSMVSVPDAYVVDKQWDVEPIIIEARNYCQRFFDENSMS